MRNKPRRNFFILWGKVFYIVKFSSHRIQHICRLEYHEEPEFINIASGQRYMY
jgi:hypothetical protein